MESITGRRPLYGVFGRGLAAPDRHGLVLGLAVLAAMTALDVFLGTPVPVVGLFVLAPFIPAVLGGVLATVVVGVLAVVVGLANPIWNSGFGEADYWIKAAGLVLGGVLAIIAARARRRARITSKRFALLDAVGAIADGSLPLAQTLDRVVELIVPLAADICMVDAIRDGRIARAAVRAAGRGDAGAVAARIREREPSVPARFVDGGAALDADPPLPRAHGGRGRSPDRSRPRRPRVPRVARPALVDRGHDERPRSDDGHPDDAHLVVEAELQRG